ncbi:glucan endo-1,3-beta-glucosidase-like isoform X1 [Tasmannia lanceolata]|uniref:glucan endo-1,3-beta-glucosidase-like isoform X1 n=1 Tax=Tasmannia lanceolata TaxID=3420 RepID=UPI0040648D79
MASPSAPALSFVYGNDRSQPIHPQDTVRHCQMNNITKLRLSKTLDVDNDYDILDELHDTHIKVIIHVPNHLIIPFARDGRKAALWVKNHILNYWPRVEFQYICVGLEMDHKDTQEVLLTNEPRSLLAAMTNIKDAIQQDPGTSGKIQVTTTIGMQDLENYDIQRLPSRPSQCIFKSRVKRILEPILASNDFNDAPLFVNVYPYEYFGQQIDVNPDITHYLFTAKAPFVIDGEYEYKYVFDLMVDALHVAVHDLWKSFRNKYVKLIVAGTGWPHEGGDEATMENARTYNHNLFQHVRNGTPRMKDALETYIFEMYDEDNKTEHRWSRHYGVYDENGRPYYPFPCPGPFPCPCPFAP